MTYESVLFDCSFSFTGVPFPSQFPISSNEIRIRGCLSAKGLGTNPETKIIFKMSKEYARVIHFAGERNDTNENVPLSSDRLNPIIQQTEFYEISTKK